MIATAPICLILVVHRFTTDDRMSANQVLGVAPGIAGVAALVGIDTLDSYLSSRRAENWKATTPVHRAASAKGALAGNAGVGE